MARNAASEAKRVTIHTDGSCLGNPGPGGFGVVLEHNGREKELSGGFRRTTNNRMEILAVIIGLEALMEPCSVTVFSDSRYVRGRHRKRLGQKVAGQRLDAEQARARHQSRSLGKIAGSPRKARR